MRVLQESQSAFVTLTQLTSIAKSSTSKNKEVLKSTSASTSTTTGSAVDIKQTVSETENTTISAAANPKRVDDIPGLRIPDGFLLRAPDWQSTDPADWVFCRTAISMT